MIKNKCETEMIEMAHFIVKKNGSFLSFSENLAVGNVKLCLKTHWYISFHDILISIFDISVSANSSNPEFSWLNG